MTIDGFAYAPVTTIGLEKITLSTETPLSLDEVVDPLDFVWYGS